MNRLNRLFLLLIILLSGASVALAQDAPGSSSDACPCFDSKVIDGLKQSGDIDCFFNIFKLEASPNNAGFDNNLIAECDNCEYGTDSCRCSITLAGGSGPTTMTNLTESEFKSCQALLTELLQSNSFQCAVSSE